MARLMAVTRYADMVKLRVIHDGDSGPVMVDNTRGDLAMPAFNRTITPCLVCGAPVSATVSMRQLGRGKYCSKPCHVADRSFSLARHFFPKIDRSGGPEACWPWLGLRDADGYGITGAAGAVGRAHRLAWEIANGQSVPAGLLMRHLCPGGGNPWCCNPKHLAPGTVKQNTADAIRAGRLCCGERVNTAKLTAEQVIEIRRRRAAGELLTALGREFSVDQGTISAIARRRNWKHIA